MALAPEHTVKCPFPHSSIVPLALYVKKWSGNAPGSPLGGAPVDGGSPRHGEIIERALTVNFAIVGPLGRRAICHIWEGKAPKHVASVLNIWEVAWRSIEPDEEVH